MNVSISARLLFLVFAVGSASACLSPFIPLSRPRGEFQPPPQQPPQQQRSIPPELAAQIREKQESDKLAEMSKPRKFDLTTETGKVLNAASEAFKKEDFQWLEREAGKARREKQRLAGGYWKLRNIYAGISSPSRDAPEEWKKHFERLNRWKERFPASITARVALAETWVEYAWEARGGGYAFTVSDEAWQLFRERLRSAEKELSEAKKLGELCPHWYLTLLVVARAQGWNSEKYDELYREAVKFEPHYYYYALEKGIYLLPRWSGKRGEWAAFAEQSANRLGGDEGLILYYLVITDYILYYGDATFSTTDFSVEKIKKGFYALKKTYGADKQRLNEFAKFVCMIADYPAANEVIKEIGDNRMNDMWGEKEFNGCKLMAAAAVAAKKNNAGRSHQ